MELLQEGKCSKMPHHLVDVSRNKALAEPPQRQNTQFFVMDSIQLPIEKK